MNLLWLTAPLTEDSFAPLQARHAVVAGPPYTRNTFTKHCYNKSINEVAYF